MSAAAKAGILQPTSAVFNCEGQPARYARVVCSMKLLLTLMALALGCTQLATAATTRDIAYGSDPRQRLDVYAPDDAHGAPVILMVHGGGWHRGDKASRDVVGMKADRWLPRGLIVVSVNYRMRPDADPLQQANDVARALAFVQSHATTWGGEATKIILMGHSAGAHLVALLTAEPALAQRAGTAPWLGTVSIDSGAINVPAIMQRRHLPLYDTAFGADPRFWQTVSPLHALSSQALPLLAICSTVRPDHPCIEAHAYARKAAVVGVRAEVLEQPLDHMHINRELGMDSQYTRAVEQFMASLDATVAARVSSR